ncbi:MAG TPA: PHB depolymerase family esterase [Solirubrobacteraceae bacterium]|nr:PHB depolymerase family esterase [Solirubrobacteraceae bacterium]
MKLLGSCLAAGILVLSCAGSASATPSYPRTGGPEPGQWQEFSYGSTLLPDTYIVYTPPSYTPGRPMPLLVMIHGCQTTAYQQMESTEFNQLAAEKGFVVLYPDFDVTGELQPGPLRQCWRFFEPGSWMRGDGDAGTIGGETMTVLSRWDINPQRVYVAGMSAGGFMTPIMIASYPDLFAAGTVAAGGSYGDGTCLLGLPGDVNAEQSAQLAFNDEGARRAVVPLLVMGGDADTSVPPPCVDQTVQQSLRTNNLVIDGSQTSPISLTPASVTAYAPAGKLPYKVSTYLDPEGCVIAQRWLIHGMAHFWPGGSPAPQWAGFTDPQAPSGADAAWSFLSSYTKPDPLSSCHQPSAARPVRRHHRKVRRHRRNSTAKPDPPCPRRRRCATIARA